MTTLHILNAAPTQTSQLSSCLRVLSAGDGIFFCGESGLIAAGIMAAFFGFILGFPVLRLRGD